MDVVVTEDNPSLGPLFTLPSGHTVRFWPEPPRNYVTGMFRKEGEQPWWPLDDETKEAIKEALEKFWKERHLTQVLAFNHINFEA